MEIWTILRNYLRLLERDIAFERSQWIRTDAAWWLVVNHAMVQYLGIGSGFEAVMVVTGLEGERSNWLWGHNRAPRRKGQKSAREIPARESFEAPLTNRLDAAAA